MEISYIGSSMIIDGEGDRTDKKAPNIFLTAQKMLLYMYQWTQ